MYPNCHTPRREARPPAGGACQNGPVTQGPNLANGGPSITAQRVAAYRLGFTRLPAPYGDTAADERLAADVAAGQEPAAGRMREYLQARTRFFDRVVVGAIGRGVRQIVVGAAGYDGRPLRYARSGVRWFEVDHPATQRDKRERLARLGLAADQAQFVEASDSLTASTAPETKKPP
jgi:O-methyltransferase involved in polyketide biosynthesis